MSDTQAAETMAPLMDAISGGEPPQSTALIILPPETFPTIIAADTDDILGGLAKELSGFKGDVTTEKGRAEIASKARKVAVAKMDLVRLSAKLKEDAQKLIKGVNSERNLIEERMDALRDQVRKPLTDFEQREAARVKAHEDAIENIKTFSAFDTIPTSHEINARITELNALPTRDWQEFAERAHYTFTAIDEWLRAHLKQAIERELAEAEAARIAEEAAEAARQEAIRLQAEREAGIARQAAEAARVAAETAAAEEAARVAAEAAQRAQEAADALVREQEEKRQAEERAARLEAIRIADRKRAIAAIPQTDDYGETETSAELEQRLRYLRAVDLDTFDEFVAEAGAVLMPEIERTSVLLIRAREREAAAAAEKARRDKIAAEAVAEAQRLDAERREQAARDAAIEAERQRVEGERLREEAATRERERNIAHKRKINGEAVADLVAAGLSEQAAKSAITLIAKGECRHVRIAY